MKKIATALVVLALLGMLASCFSDDSDYSYDYDDDNGLTQQDIDNIDFYHEMEDAWNKYRD